MVNLRDDKRLTFRHKFRSRNPKDHVETALVVLVLYTIYFPFTHQSLVGRNGQLLFVCIYCERELRLEELHRRYEKGEIGDARAYRILHSVAHIVRAVGDTRRYQPWKLNVTRKRNVTIFRVSAGGSCFVASRFSFRFSKLLYAHRQFFQRKTVIAIEGGKFEILSSKPIGFFNFILRADDRVYRNAQ